MMQPIPPAFAPPDDALAALKAWLAISGEAEDAALWSLLRASCEICDAFTAGSFAEASEWADLPEAVRHGIVRLAAHQFRQRDDDRGAGLPPAAVAALWRPFRRLRVA